MTSHDSILVLVRKAIQGASLDSVAAIGLQTSRIAGWSVLTASEILLAIAVLRHDEWPAVASALVALLCGWIVIAIFYLGLTWAAEERSKELGEHSLEDAFIRAGRRKRAKDLNKRELVDIWTIEFLFLHSSPVAIVTFAPVIPILRAFKVPFELPSYIAGAPFYLSGKLVAVTYPRIERLARASLKYSIEESDEANRQQYGSVALGAVSTSGFIVAALVLTTAIKLMTREVVRLFHVLDSAFNYLSQTSSSGPPVLTKILSDTKRNLLAPHVRSRILLDYLLYVTLPLAIVLASELAALGRLLFHHSRFGPQQRSWGESQITNHLAAFAAGSGLSMVVFSGIFSSNVWASAFLLQFGAAALTGAGIVWLRSIGAFSSIDRIVAQNYVREKFESAFDESDPSSIAPLKIKEPDGYGDAGYLLQVYSTEPLPSSGVTFGGHQWAAFATHHMTSVEDLDWSEVDLDPESDMFVAYSESRGHLYALAQGMLRLAKQGDLTSVNPIQSGDGATS